MQKPDKAFLERIGAGHKVAGPRRGVPGTQGESPGAQSAGGPAIQNSQWLVPSERMILL